jgi:hypothetical protein
MPDRDNVLILALKRLRIPDRRERARQLRLDQGSLTHRTEFRVSLLADRRISKGELGELLERRFPHWSSTFGALEIDGGRADESTSADADVSTTAGEHVSTSADEQVST